jgi:subtilase family serine protease
MLQLPVPALRPFHNCYKYFGRYSLLELQKVERLRNIKKNIISALLILMIIATSWPLLRGIAFGRYVNPNNVGIHPTLLEHQGTAAESPSGFSPAQIRTAYNLPSSGGSDTIAIIDAFDDPTVLDDLNVFSSQFNLPPVNSTNFEKHMMAPSIPENDWWAAEISLDVQWAHAIAPSAKILLVEAQDNSNPSLYSAVDYARNRADVVAISMSWGGPEYYEETDQDFHFTSDYGASFFASSGDEGAFHYLYPAASPNVIAVGGTVLTLNVDGSVASETGWDRSGGFRSWREPEPLYQLAYGVLSIGSYRVVPDVSYHAVNYSTYESFNPSESGWFNETGTSAGAPQWAAIESLGLSCFSDRFYKIASGPLYQSDFRDITSGNNGQPAGPGFDYVTGLGSPLTTVFDYPSPAR